ncbi:MAG: hypothetical protein LBP59_04910 [Planctomycetaceae bacterium]|nr:hypothetical protein [Planctomycetaceae bacterium]
MRLYSTAGERGFDRNRFIGCLSAKCRRDARDPLVSPAFQDRRRLACDPFVETAAFILSGRLRSFSIFLLQKNCPFCLTYPFKKVI